MEDNDEKVGMAARKHRDVHGHGGGEGFVEPHAKVALSAQQEEDKHT